jgi:hypothetical protein
MVFVGACLAPMRTGELAEFGKAGQVQAGALAPSRGGRRRLNVVGRIMGSAITSWYDSRQVKPLSCSGHT